jgi:hypothetical protein
MHAGERSLRVMKKLLVIASVFGSAYADDVPKMIVQPSATKVAALAKANLTVSPLEHQEKAYVGSYQLKVTPFTFKSESGKLFLNAPEETVRQIKKGQPVAFTGKATNAAGEVKIVRGKTTPETNEHGAVTFSVETENGSMVFNTSYQLVKE